MQLRIKSVEMKESLIFDIPNPCSLQLLRELIYQKLLSPSCSSPISLSLNKKDVLTTTSPEDSIQSIGVTDGDLIYFTTNLNGFSSEAPELFEQSQNSQALIHNISSEKGKMVDFTSEDDEKPIEIESDRSSVGKVESFSVLCFLRKVFKEELGDHCDDDGPNHMLFELTVRAAFLESGFVEVGPVLNSSNRNNVQREWYLPTFYYTLPKIITSGKTETVKIRFQSLGKYCRIYGCLVDGTMVHSVLLDKARLVFFSTVVWANWEDVIVVVKATNQATDIQPKKEVLKFWRSIKDELVLPLLSDLCEKVGLEPPPCFMQLPTDLKLKILESVSGVDMARLSCVCSKLRCLISCKELWRDKYFTQFGGFGCFENDKWTYKELYARAWKNWKAWRSRLTDGPVLKKLEKSLHGVEA